jgi:adenylylsulfate kinase
VTRDESAASRNLVWHPHKVSRSERAAQKRQKPCIVWLTGLSGSGKSTIANALEGELFESGHHSYLLDGDNIRLGLNKNLGFSDADRTENIRRIGEVSKLFVDAGLIVITAFISPFRADRDLVRALVAPDEFVEVFVRAPLDVCEQRDPKGLYKKARAGAIKQFTGIDSPYEEPLKPELTLDTDKLDLQQSTQALLAWLRTSGRLQA